MAKATFFLPFLSYYPGEPETIEPWSSNGGDKMIPGIQY